MNLPLALPALVCHIAPGTWAGLITRASDRLLAAMAGRCVMDQDLLTQKTQHLEDSTTIRRQKYAPDTINLITGGFFVAIQGVLKDMSANQGHQKGNAPTSS